MLQVVMNGNTYNLKRYELDGDNDIRLGFNISENYNLSTLENDILTNEGIQILEDNEEKDFFSGYNKIKYLSKNYSMLGELIIQITASDTALLLETLKTKLEENSAIIAEYNHNIQNIVDYFNSEINFLKHRIDELSSNNSTD